MGNFMLETMHCWYLFIHNWKRFPWDGKFPFKTCKEPKYDKFWPNSTSVFTVT